MRDTLQCKITSHYIDIDELQSNIANLPNSIDAIFIGIPYEWNQQKAKMAFDKLIEMKIPSLVMNDSYLNSGALLSYSKNTSLDFILRKLAIMVGDVLEEVPLSEMSIYVNEKSETSLNIQTAKSIDYSPEFIMLFTANIIESQTNEKTPCFSVQQLIHKALEENLNISISKKDVALTENDIALAKSQFLPTVDADVTALTLDKNRSSSIIGLSEQSVIIGGKIQQLIYSESAIANIAIQKHLLKAQEFATEQEISDQLLSVFNSYFALLQAKTNLAIQIENLDATKQNLELAQKRNTIGITNQSDIFRWKSELASAKQNVIEAYTQHLSLKYQLNTFLNNTLPKDFEIADATIDDNLFVWFRNSGLGQAISTQASLYKLIIFLTEESINNYPAKNQLLSNIDAIERQQLMNKRLYYSPTIALQGQVNRNLYRGGLGSAPLSGSEFYNNTWDIGLSVSYPILQGNRRKLNINENKIVLEQLDEQSTDLSQNLKLHVEINTLNIVSSKANIENSRIAKNNAEKNFLLVQKNYQLGTINITQLIDAQKNLFSVRQAFSIAIYQYLLNFIKLENCIGFYSILATEEEKNNFLSRYLEFMSNN